MLPYYVHLCGCVIKKKAPYRYSQKIYPSLWSVLIWLILLWTNNEIELHFKGISFEKLVIRAKSQEDSESFIILSPKDLPFHLIHLNSPIHSHSWAFFSMKEDSNLVLHIHFFRVFITYSAPLFTFSLCFTYVCR